jgi:hypothetical protein
VGCERFLDTIHGEAGSDAQRPAVTVCLSLAIAADVNRGPNPLTSFNERFFPFDASRRTLIFLFLQTPDP